MASANKALAAAHAAAARRASKARVAALRAGTAPGPIDATWAQLMQRCHEAHRTAEAAETVEAWHTAATAARVLNEAVGVSEKCEAPTCNMCAPYQFVPAGVVMPTHEPTPAERTNARAYATRATRDIGLGLGALLLKTGRRGEACGALATVLRADEACASAWALRGAAFAAMVISEDGAVLEIVELHLQKAASLSPADDEAQAAHAVAAARAAGVYPTATDQRPAGTLAEDARRAVLLLNDGAALMREGLYRSAAGRYVRAAAALDALPGPRPAAAANEARLNAAGCLLQCPGDHDISGLCADSSPVALLRRAAALEKRGDYESALADLREARISSAEKPLIDARVAHCEHLRATRGSVKPLGAAADRLTPR